MRRQFFEMLDSGGEGFNELVVAASARIKRPKHRRQQADSDSGSANPLPRSPLRRNSRLQKAARRRSARYIPIC